MARDDVTRDDLDDLDHLLDDGRAQLEARFRALEREAEIDGLRQRTAGGADPLAEMKAALDNDTELERYLLVVCPGCQATNRMSLTRVRSATPLCGRCKQDLSFVRVSSPQ